MASGQLTGVLRRLRRAALLADGGGMTDGQLLERFVGGRDEAAFEALVRRHAPTVWGVCRRVLGHAQDAEDAFQATFLVFFQKAPAIARPESVGSWLYGTACRVALRARRARRRARERPVGVPPEPATAAEEGVDPALWAVLDREVNRLPEKYRMAVVLCDLEGGTRRDVARRLGIPEGTLSGRLTTARRLLAGRLSRHGFALSGGALAWRLSEGPASARVPPRLLAAALAAGRPAGPAGGVIAWAGGVKAMFASKLGIAAAVLAASTLAGGVAALVHPTPTGPERAAVRRGAQGRLARQDDRKPAPAAWKERRAIDPRGDQDPQIFSASLPPDGKTVACGMTTRGKLVDLATGRVRATVEQGDIRTTAFSPDGKALATGHSQALMLWDAATGKALATLDGKAGNVSVVQFSPDGKLLASAETGTVRLWDVAARKEHRRLDTGKPEGRVVYSVAFSPDGRTLASAEGPARTVKLWDVATGMEIATLEGHREFAIAVAFSPDGKTLASAGGEGLVKLWDVATGKERASLKGPVQAFGSLAFSPDGRTLASAGGQARTVRLWDVATGKEIATLKGHTKQVWTVAFSPDGKTLVTAGDDAVRIWSEE